MKYCLDNDTTRFAWASSSGKGVIYRMIDEFENDVPYDFKNIMFYHSDDELYYYTFSKTPEDFDVSLNGLLYRCYSNTIRPYVVIQAQVLNRIIFVGWYGDGLHCYSNTFSANCYANTFAGGCHSNDFGNNCYSNTFGEGCAYNTFGNNCYDTTFDYWCSDNKFETACHSNTFGNSSYDNAFGHDCSTNTFGNGCAFNTFGNHCGSNAFGNGCSYDNLGTNCNSNTFGDSCSYNTFGSDCRDLKISDNTSTQKRYISVDSGVQGASSANRFDLYDSAILDKNYQVTFKKSASGKYLMLWATDTGTMTGKVKATNTTPTWSNIV